MQRGGRTDLLIIDLTKVFDKVGHKQATIMMLAEGKPNAEFRISSQIALRKWLRIGSWLACVYRVMDARGKFGEDERSVRVGREQL